MSSVNREFEQALKSSPHLLDILNTDRIATAEIIAAFVRALVEAKQMDPQAALRVLRGLDAQTQRPSIDGARSRIVLAIREILQKVP